MGKVRTKENKDHAKALIKIFLKGKINEKYNIGSGYILNNLQVARIILKIFKEKKTFISNSKIIFVKDRPGHDKRYALNSNKLLKTLNIKKFQNFEKGIRKTIQWYIKNPEWINSINKKFYKRYGLI